MRDRLGEESLPSYSHPKRLVRVVETLRRLDASADGLASVRLLVADRRVVWARSDSELVDLLHGGQLMLVFPVGEAVADVARAAEDLDRSAGSGLLGGERGRRR